MAPTEVAAASLEGTRSMATTCPAPARTAPITHDRPTPPRPITATDAPAGTPAVLVTAPTPVATQQPMSAAAAGSTPSGIGMAAAAGTTSASARVPIAQYVSTSCPVDRRQRAPPSGMRWRKDGEFGARPWSAGGARAADAAWDEPRQRDRLADREPVDARPERLDDARAFVAEHDRSGPLPLPVAHVEVGMADAGRQHPHAHLAGARLGELEVFDPARRPGSFQTAARVMGSEDSVSRLPPGPRSCRMPRGPGGGTRT